MPDIYHICQRPLTGVWSVMKTLAQYQQASLGMSVHLVILADRGWPHRQEPGEIGLPCHFVELPAFGGGVALAYLELARVGRRISCLFPEPALAHYHNAWMAGALLEGRGHAHAVVTFHGLPTDSHFTARPGRAAWHRHLARRVLRSGAALASVDAEAVARAPQLLGIPAGRFTVVPNGVSDTHGRGCPRLQGAPVMTLGFLGALSDPKGWPLAAVAVARLAQSGQPVRLLIAGTGSPEARDQAERLCAQTGNGSRYFGEIRNPRESFIPGIDALLLPTSGEGLPMSVLECLSAAVPVIATRVGGLPEILEDRVNGLFVQCDPVEIAGAVQMLLEEPALHATLSRNARRSFEIKGHVSQMAEGYRRIYRRVAPALCGLEQATAYL